jgi:hypothetical protein
LVETHFLYQFEIESRWLVFRVTLDCLIHLASASSSLPISKAASVLNKYEFLRVSSELSRSADLPSLSAADWTFRRGCPV